MNKILGYAKTFFAVAAALFFFPAALFLIWFLNKGMIEGKPNKRLRTWGF